jgi:hypothetical protein
MNYTDIDKIIKKKQDKTDIKKTIFYLDAKTKFRTITTYKSCEKQSYNLALEYHKVDSTQSRSYLLRYGHYVQPYPRWMLNTEFDENVPIKKSEDKPKQIID